MTIASISAAVAIAFADQMAYLRPLSMLETGNNDYAIGSVGERSRWQIRKTTWNKYCKLPFESHSRNPKISAAVAGLHVQYLHNKLTTAYGGREPSPAQLYCAWNMGLTGFRRRKYLVSRCPAAVQERAERYANLYADIKYHQ
jgi:hypothetical protein